MSIYRLPVHVRTAIDKLRKYFLWYDDHTVKEKILLSFLKSGMQKQETGRFRFD
jgi:hypothetical protein